MSAMLVRIVLGLLALSLAMGGFVIGVRLLWSAAQSRHFGWFVALSGVCGISGVLVGGLVPAMPPIVAGVGFVLSVVACYGALFIRQRRRGGDVWQALVIAYDARLTGFERAVFGVMAAGLLVLTLLPPAIDPVHAFGRILSGLATVVLIYSAVTARPPWTAARADLASRSGHESNAG